MRHLVIYFCLHYYVGHVRSFHYLNDSMLDPASHQLSEFRYLHPRPIGVITKLSGEPLDVRDVQTLNSDIFIHRNQFRLTAHKVRERIPERVVHAKGVAAFGYFVVTHDVSKYIKSDVFNGIGKRTPVVARFSTALQNIGGTDLAREIKGVGIKMYTLEGNLDFLCTNIPIYLYKDPLMSQKFTHSFKRNPRTNMFDTTASWDFVNLHADIFHMMLWVASDLGLPDGYRKMNAFTIHTYEVYNKHGDRSYVKFNFRTETGLFNLTYARARAIGVDDPDYFNRDLYNAIALKKYPSWKLEMDILTKDDLLKVDYDPFDMTRSWKQGTYRTVTVGRLVFNRNIENHFKDAEQSAFNPENLVPGIKGPVDFIFRARKIFYPDAQNYRLGVNYDNIRVNAPLYENVYSQNGNAPLLNSMRDAPNYYPNSFNGPMPFVDEARPGGNIVVYHRNAVDLQPMAEFYNEVTESDAHRQRIANVLAGSLRTVPWDVERNAIRILTLIDKDLGRRVRGTLSTVRAVNVEEKRNRVAQCIANVNKATA